MQTILPAGLRPDLITVFELALKTAANAQGLPRSCRRRGCRTSGRCALRHEPETGIVDRGCALSFATALAAATHVEFLFALGAVDPDGSLYYECVASPKRREEPQSGRGPEPWARLMAKAFGIPEE